MTEDILNKELIGFHNYINNFEKNFFSRKKRMSSRWLAHIYIKAREYFLLTSTFQIIPFTNFVPGAQTSK